MIKICQTCEVPIIKKNTKDRRRLYCCKRCRVAAGIKITRSKKVIKKCLRCCVVMESKIWTKYCCSCLEKVRIENQKLFGSKNYRDQKRAKRNLVVGGKITIQQYKFDDAEKWNTYDK